MEAQATQLESSEKFVARSPYIFKTALNDSLPVMFGYIPFAAAFGFVFEQMGFPWFYAALMSLFTYAGSAQMVAVSLMAEGESVFEVVVMVLLINSRHIFYGLSVMHRFPKALWQKLILIHGLTDETFSVLTGPKRFDDERDYRYCWYLTGLHFFYWNLGSLLGSLLGVVVTFDIPGLDFVMPALFTVLTIEQAYNVKSATPFVLAALFGTLTLFIVPGQMLVVTISICAIFLAGQRILKAPIAKDELEAISTDKEYS